MSPHAAGPLDCACNSAQPSPCGAFVALLKDDVELELVSMAAKDVTKLAFNVGDRGAPRWESRGLRAGDCGGYHSLLLLSTARM